MCNSSSFVFISIVVGSGGRWSGVSPADNQLLIPGCPFPCLQGKVQPVTNIALGLVLLPVYSPPEAVYMCVSVTIMVIITITLFFPVCC